MHAEWFKSGSTKETLYISVFFTFELSYYFDRGKKLQQQKSLFSHFQNIMSSDLVNQKFPGIILSFDEFLYRYVLIYTCKITGWSPIPVKISYFQNTKQIIKAHI